MSEPVSVRILDRDYLIACTQEERPGLMRAAALLDDKLRELRNAGTNRGGGLDRIAVLAALNLAHELLDLRSRTEIGSNALARQIDRLKSKLDAGLPPAP